MVELVVPREAARQSCGSTQDPLDLTDRVRAEPGCHVGVLGPQCPLVTRATEGLETPDQDGTSVEDVRKDAGERGVDTRRRVPRCT